MLIRVNKVDSLVVNVFLQMAILSNFLVILFDLKEDFVW